MSQSELSLQLSGSTADNITVDMKFDNVESGYLPFTPPLTQKDRQDIRWYAD